MIQNNPIMTDQPTVLTLDGNEAAAYVAYRVNEVCAIYPITPSSTMAELADEWSAKGLKNLWGNVPEVIEMQSEGGAAGTVHGALQTGALTTTFTASQGLMLMLPNMYKIAGELTSTVFHVAARSLAAQGLSIFGDHSDVMAARTTGFAMLSSASVQEAHDMALIAQAATLESRLPFIHFFDGFRTSHEVNKLTLLQDAQIRAMVQDEAVIAHRRRALNPDNPFIRGTAQNPDVYFQGRETVNPFYAKTPDVVAQVMARFAEVTGRTYLPFEYRGAPDAERVVVIMGSGGETAEETAEFLVEQGEKVGVLLVRLYRPFSADYFLRVLPKTVRKIAVLDRCKEPGSSGEPLYQDVLSTFVEAFTSGLYPHMPRIIGGRYGLSSKEFTPGMAKAVFDELKADHPKNHFTDVRTKLLSSIGFGVDAFHGVCHSHVLETVAALSKDGGYLGAFSLLPAMPEFGLYRSAVEFVNAAMPEQPSIVNSSIAAAVEGDFGDAHRTHRTRGSRLWINPLMAMYFTFDLAAVARRVLYLPHIKNTQTMFEVSAIIEGYQRGCGVLRPWASIPV